MEKNLEHSSEKHFDVLILSAWGRGAKLALDIVRSKKKTAFIDLSDGVSVSSKVSKDDLDGPFGCFITEKLQDRKWMIEPSGFSVRSHKNCFHFKEFFLHSVYQKRKEFQELLHPSNSKDFQVTWLRHLICALASGVFKPFNFRNKNSASFVFKEFGVFEDSSKAENSLEKLKEEGVFILKTDKFFQKKNKICLKNGENFKAKSVICFLNPDELTNVFEEVLSSSKWAWRRFPFEWNQNEKFPLYTALADPDNLPWTHDRLLCLKKSSVSPWKINVWGLFPKDLDLSESAERITKTLNKFFPDFGWSFSGGLSPSFLFPVYSEKQPSLKKYGWIEAWPFNDLSENGRAAKELEILSKIK